MCLTDNATFEPEFMLTMLITLDCLICYGVKQLKSKLEMPKSIKWEKLNSYEVFGQRIGSVTPKYKVVLE